MEKNLIVEGGADLAAVARAFDLIGREVKVAVDGGAGTKYIRGRLVRAEPNVIVVDTGEYKYCITLRSLLAFKWV